MLLSTHLTLANIRTRLAPRRGESVSALLVSVRSFADRARFEWISRTAHHLEETCSRDALQTYYSILRGPTFGTPLETYELAFGVAVEYWRLNPPAHIAETAALTAADVRNWLNVDCLTCRAACRFAGVGRLPQTDDEPVRCSSRARKATVGLVM